MTAVQELDCSVDLLRSLLWQHDNAESLKTLLSRKQEWMEENHCQFWENWNRDVFDINTANEFGLSVWAKILNIRLGFSAMPGNPETAFGFGDNNQNFGNGNFYRASQAELNLTTEQKRLVINLRYFQLVSRGTVPEINEFLKLLFGSNGDVYVVDPHDMSFATYFFKFQPDSQLLLVLEKFDLLPRPSTVGVLYLVAPDPSFGFGPFNLNFNNGNFGA